MRIKLAIILFSLFLLIAFTALGLSTFIHHRNIQAMFTSHARQSLFTGALQTALTLDTFIETNLLAILTEARIPLLAAYLSLPANQRSGSNQETEVLALLQALSRKNERFIASYALLDNQGINRVDTNPAGVNQNEFDFDYFQVPLKTALPYISPVQFLPPTAEPALYFASPVHNTAGEIIGVLRARYHPAILQQFIAQNNGIVGPASFAVLVDENYLYLAHGTEPEIVFKLVNLPDPERVSELQAAGRLPSRPLAELSTNLPELEQNLAKATTQPFFIVEDSRTSHINHAAIISLKTQPWLVAYFQPQEELLAPVEVAGWSDLVLAVIIAGLMVPVAFGAAVFVMAVLSKSNI